MSETGAQPGVWIARPFGTTSTGEAVTCYRIENPSGAWVEVLDYGCTLRGIGVPDKNGRITDVLLGYDCIEDYEAGSAYLGAVGRPLKDYLSSLRFRGKQVLLFVVGDLERAPEMASLRLCVPAGNQVRSIKIHPDEGKKLCQFAQASV